MAKFRSFLAFLLFFLLPAGLAKHWLTDASLVNGVLVDYLMPDLWLQDVIATIFIVANVRHQTLNLKTVFTPVLLVLTPVLFSHVPLISLIYAFRFFLAFSVSYLLFKNPDLKEWARKGLTWALIWTGILALLQFIDQGTVFGWWFLGEPVFGLGSGGVKKIEILGKLLVAPMATFSHANVLAGFALLGFIVLTQEKRKDWLAKVAIVAAIGSLLLSFSIYTWVIGVLTLMLSVKRQMLKSNFKILTVVFSFLLLAFSCWLSISDVPSVSRRLELARVSLKMFADYPFFGVGWGVFVKAIPAYWRELSIVNRFLQPVHNIFLLVLSEGGIVGSLGWVLLLKKIFNKADWLMVTSYLLLFFFDHYFLTTTQGLYMMVLLLTYDRLSN